MDSSRRRHTLFYQGNDNTGDGLSASIFLIGANDQLTELQQADYESEDLLQRLLASYPSILGVSGPAGVKLLLIRREFGVPEDEHGSDRWSLDHLFVDQSGVPVLVEVKRATDSRSRREVVAQMLDYAANGVAFWPIERLVAAYTEGARSTGLDPEAVLGEFLDGADPDAFWRQVDANLRAGRVRMVFVADRIPPELRRIVEFLNEQMRPAEVLAVEVEQFTAPGGFRTLVPRLVGRTQRAEAAKAVREPLTPISEDEWLVSFEPTARAAAVRAIAWFRSNGFHIAISASRDSMSMSIPKPAGRPAWPFFIRRSSQKLETALGYLKNDPAFASDAAREQLLNRLRSVPGVSITTAKLTGWPAIPLDLVARDEVWAAFREIALDVANRIRGGAAEA